LEPDQRREFLENLNEPPKLQLRAPAKKVKRARKKITRRKSTR
jgi:hypothetical protein